MPKKSKQKRQGHPAGRERRTHMQAVPAPVQVDNEEKYAPNVWTSSTGSPYADLVVPSGQTCLVRKPNVEGLMKAGVLNDLDSFSALVDEKHIRRVDGKPPRVKDPKKMLEDPKQMENILHVANRVTCYVVVKPEVHMPPNDVTSRKPGLVYADMIDLEDKMFILAYAVGGTKDLEDFRRRRDEVVRGMESVEDVQAQAE